jgi:hypothetical protein
MGPDDVCKTAHTPGSSIRTQARRNLTRTGPPSALLMRWTIGYKYGPAMRVWRLREDYGAGLIGYGARLEPGAAVLLTHSRRSRTAAMEHLNQAIAVRRRTKATFQNGRRARDVLASEARRQLHWKER